MTQDLTNQQEAIYEYLKKEIRNSGFPPSVREICAAVGLSSTSSVHSHLKTLEKRGYIRRDKNKNRSIEILDDDFYAYRGNYVNVPVVGSVAAGRPIFAYDEFEEYFPIHAAYLNGDEGYMLRVSGDSMLGAGIFDKDLLLVKKRTDARDGDVVVALLEDSVTVKTFYLEDDGRARLQPENPDYEPIITRNVEIVGIVAGLFRKY